MVIDPVTSTKKKNILQMNIKVSPKRPVEELQSIFYDLQRNVSSLQKQIKQ